MSFLVPFKDLEIRHLTAFVTPEGLYEWIRLLRGLKNALAELLTYRAVIVYSKSFDECVQHVRIDDAIERKRYQPSSREM